MSTLYEIDQAIVMAWENAIDPETGEIREEGYAALEALQMERERKLENIACWIKDLRSDMVALKAEAEALTERAAHKANKADSLERYLAAALNGERFETARCAVTWRKSDAVQIMDQDEIPGEYMTEKTTIAPDKKAIKAALKSGIPVPGCSLETRNNISVK